MDEKTSYNFQIYLVERVRTRTVEGESEWLEHPFRMRFLRSMGLIQKFSMFDRWKVISPEESREYNKFYTIYTLEKLVRKV